MPEPRSALIETVREGRLGPNGEAGVTLTERRLVVVQVQSRKDQDATLSAAVLSELQLPLPDPGHTSVAGDATAAWIAPGAWLILAPLHSAGSLPQRLATAASGSASITDQTFGKTVLRISGVRARDVLAKGCRVDLHPRSFGPGRAAVTPIAGINCVLTQVDGAPTFDLIVPSTLAESFFQWLRTSAAEFGCEVLAPKD